MIRGCTRPLSVSNVPNRKRLSCVSSAILTQQRNVNRGFLGNKIRSVQQIARMPGLDKHETAGKPSDIKIEREKFIKERAFMLTEFNKLFGQEETSSITKKSENKQFSSSVNFSSRRALHMVNMLRPKADPFHKEDSKWSMEARLNAATGATGAVDNLQFNLPVLDTKAFTLAIEAISYSMADDLEELCKVLEVENLPEAQDPLRFKRIVDALCISFQLQKDPAAAAEWTERCWPRLKRILPQQFQSVTNDQMTNWLRSHLGRVIHHQRLAAEGNGPQISSHKGTSRNSSIRNHTSRISSQWYDLSEDFLYDSWPLQENVVDELNIRFPLDRSKEFFRGFARAFGWDLDSYAVHQAEEALGALVEDLKGLGLRNWLETPIEEFENYLPQGPLPFVDYAGEAVLKGAKTMLKAAARGKGSLLDFEQLDPYAVIHKEPGFQLATIQEEIDRLPDNEHFTDTEIDTLIDMERAARTLSNVTDKYLPQDVASFIAEQGKTPLEILMQSEAESVASIGPGQWSLEEGRLGDWRWAKPASSVLDARTGQYIRENAFLDPNMRLDKLRQLLVEIRRCSSMTSTGRVGYYRAIIAVGDGRGLFGYGIGFGRMPEDARADAAQKAIKNLDPVDVDEGRTLTFPVKAQEFGAQVKIWGRPVGRGLQGGSIRSLPLLFLTGLDNAKVTFPANARKMPKMRALRRALDRLQSRRTIANATGKKFASLVAPGDHWVHWPDKWFRPIAHSYVARMEALKQQRPLSYRPGGRHARVSEVVPSDLRPERTRYTRQTPLEKWQSFHAKRMQTAFDAWQPVGSKNAGSNIDLAIRLGTRFNSSSNSGSVSVVKQVENPSVSA